MRAAATHRTDQGNDQVLDDPLARRFLPLPLRAAARVAARLPADPLSAYVPLRHRFIDDVVETALDAGVAQVVLLGTGYDTRPWRLGTSRAGIRWFEIDHPATLRQRERLLADLSGPQRVTVPVDFRHDPLLDRLQAAGHRADAPTAWVWEGVSMYLSRQEVVSCLEGLRAHSAPGSRLALDLWHRVDDDGLRAGLRRALPSLLEVIGEPVRFGVHPADARGWLGARGWNILEQAGHIELRARYQARHRPDPSMYVVEAEPLRA